MYLEPFLLIRIAIFPIFINRYYITKLSNKIKKKLFKMKNKTYLITTLALLFLSFSSCIFDPIETSLLDRLQKFQYVSIDFNADIESNNEIVSFSSLSVDNTPPFGVNQDYSLEWTDKSFTVNFDYDYELFDGTRCHRYGTISGTLSEDAKTIETFNAEETADYPDDQEVYKNFITVIDVPYNADYTYDDYTPRFGAEGPGVSNHIYSYSQSWDFFDSDGNAQKMYSTTINYNHPDDIPYLHITFSGD